MIQLRSYWSSGSSEQGDDKNDGQDESRPVRTAAQAIKIANRTGLDIMVLGDSDTVERLSAKLEHERKKY